MDHIGGFIWLLRSRVGGLPPCRLYGPPGLAANIRGLIDGFLWDRVGARGSAFDIAELHENRLHRYLVQAGKPEIANLGETPTSNGLILEEPGFRIRSVTLDHHTPVLAFAFEPDAEFNVRKDRLQVSGLEPGPWLNELKQRLRAGEEDALIPLPNGNAAQAGGLARELILTTPGKRLVFATDLGDTLENRRRLAWLARHAHTLFLEASFAEAEAGHAAKNGHLTARACGEIAQAAGVSHLVPFHLSRRYADNPQLIFDELTAACSRAVLPKFAISQMHD
jgi:ribonuclease BN (tRNA processing enzyme)